MSPPRRARPRRSIRSGAPRAPAPGPSASPHRQAICASARAADADALLALMRAYYAYDGIRFDRRVQRPALDRLLRDRSLGRVFLIRRALSFVEAWVRARGVRAIHVAVERANRKALAFYRKVGFPGPERYLLTRRVARSRLRAIVGRRLRRAP